MSKESESGGFLGWLDGAWDKAQGSASDLWDSVSESQIAKINDKLSATGGPRPETVQNVTPPPVELAGSENFVTEYKTPIMIGLGVLLLGGIAYAVKK